MNRIDDPVSDLNPTGKSATEMWDAVTRSLDKVLTVLAERDRILADPMEADAALGIYSQALNKISTLAADYKSLGLVAITMRMSRHVTDMREQARALADADLDFLEQWPMQLATFLTAPDSPSAMQALVAHLHDDHWPNPLPLNEGKAVMELLRNAGGVPAAGSDQVIDETPVQGRYETSTTGTVEKTDTVAAESSVSAASTDTGTRNAVADVAPLLEEMEILFATAEQFDVLGLQEICLRVQHNIERYQEEDSLDQAALDRLSRFPPLAYDYLASPQAPEVASALVDFLRGDWPAPLDADEAEAMLFLLQDGFGVPTQDADAGAQDVPPDTQDVPAAQAAPDIQGVQEAPVAEDLPDTQEAPATQAVDITIEAGQDMPAQTAADVGDESYVAAPQSVTRELMGLFTQELLETQTELARMLVEALSPESPAEQRREAIENYAEQIERIGMGAEAVGLSSMSRYATSMHRRIHHAASSGLTAQQHEALVLLPGSLRAYLAAPDDPSTGAGLIDLLQGDIWRPSPEPGYVNALTLGLAMVELTKDAPDAVARQTQAQPEDVVLTLPADLNQELLDGLLLELPVHTGEFSAAIQHLAAGSGTLADIDVAKRAAHTLKGAANTVGIRGIATLTHHVEDILVALSKHAALPNRALAETLSNAGDCLEAMGEAVMGTGPEPDYALAVVQEILDWANKIDREGIPAADDEMAHAPSDASNVGSGDESGAAAGAASLLQHEAMVRVPASLIDELLRLMGENIISTGQLRERLRRLVQQNRVLQDQNHVFLQLAIELEEMVDLRDAGRTFGQARDDDDFDPLEFEHYSELHTLSRRLIEAATDAGELSRDSRNELSDLNELVEVQSRLHTQGQNTVLRTRMVPVATIVSRMQRSVRQAARLLDKQVALVVNGADTMVDSNILNDLVDPLMHMLRNSVDHGIEPPPQRAAAGKSGEGRIELSFLREGNQVVVRCRDDGAGLNLAAIKRNAEEKGLIAVGQSLSDDELARLIFAPGFSTRNESTQVSGRGIGMDVVYSRVLQLKGIINLHGTAGQGLEIEIRLPATLISTYALLVRARQHVFAISSYGIYDIHYVTPDQIHAVGAEQFFRLGEEIYPLADFSALLNLPHSRRGNERDGGFPVLLVRQDSGAIHAVRVQEIIDSSDLVVKGFGRYVPKPQGVVGATILGDGSVAAVIDLPEVMRKSVRLTSAAESQDSKSSRSDAAGGRALRFTALVVDDSLSARRATAQFMKDAGFDVRTAIDGLEAVSILDKWKPKIMLVDMEMPRMNGLELTSHVRARDGMENVPVIMITSRSTEKHRQQAESAGVNVYLTKPFSDDQLLKHVMELTAT
jgi:chemotaxis protein histidine kinase CheA